MNPYVFLQRQFNSLGWYDFSDRLYICKNNDKLYIWQLKMKKLKLNDQSLINFEKKLEKLKD